MKQLELNEITTYTEQIIYNNQASGYIENGRESVQFEKVTLVSQGDQIAANNLTAKSYLYKVFLGFINLLCSREMEATREC